MSLMIPPRLLARIACAGLALPSPAAHPPAAPAFADPRPAPQPVRTAPATV